MVNFDSTTPCGNAATAKRVRSAIPLRLLLLITFAWISSTSLGTLHAHAPPDGKPGSPSSGDSRFLTPLSNLGLLTFRIAGVSSSLVVVSVDETEHAQDLNADGDELDVVVHVFDSRTGLLKNLRLAGNHYFPVPGVGDDLVAFLVPEPSQADLDLNGDGDRLDSVLHVYDARTGRTTNLELATNNATPLVHGEYVSFVAIESSNGRDLNLDGDAIDFPVHVYHSRTETLVSLGLSTGHLLGGHRSVLAFSALESFGFEDLNGDGDLADSLLHVYDASSGELRNLGLDGIYRVSMDEHRLAASAGEAENAIDFNRDGDLGDAVLHLYDIGSDRLLNVGLASSSGLPTIISGHLIVFAVAESLQNQTDLNGDGDPLDHVVFIYDSIAERAQNTGLAVAQYGTIEVSGSRLAIQVPESEQGGFDLNGDGDAEDNVAHIHEAFFNLNTNLALASLSIRLVDNQLALAVSELQQGLTDLNGDGDNIDHIVFVHDLDSGVSRNLRLSGTPECKGSGSHVFQISEEGSGEQDFNGDGDTEDRVAFHFENQSGRLTNLRLSYQFASPPTGDLLSLYSDEGLGGNGLTPQGPSPPVSTVHVLDLSLGDRAGTVNAGHGSVEDVLFLNGSAGETKNRVIEFNVLAPLQIEMRRPSSIVAPERAPYAVYAWLGEPDFFSARRLPFGLGSCAMAMPLACGSPAVIWNNAGRASKLGVPTRSSNPAPDRFVNRSVHRHVAKFFIQGLIYDPASSAEIPASVTNGIVARPVFTPVGFLNKNKDS